MRRETMLPSELLVVWKRKGVIWPRYARLSNDNLEIASGLIEVYRRRVGEKKRVLKEFVGELEDRGYDYRFVRGLSFLLDRRSVFRCNDRVSPVDLRRKTFQATEEFGLPTTPEQRSQIIEKIASELKITPEMVEELFYADLDSESILEKFDPPSPQELLERYNLSLTQTLLFDSTELNFTTAGNWQKIFYTVKKLGLIYEAYKDGRLWVKIDGPASLFKLTRRYGTAIAKLLPFIVANPEWTVEAKILWKYTNEICDFKIESWKHHSLLRSYLTPISYDSIVEEDFAARFEALESGWCLRREPEPVLAGKQVIIPDFSLEREGIKVYVEIVGFWTMEYLLRKIEKLKKIDVNMFVAVNETLACEKLASLEKYARLNVIYYRDRIPLAPILRYLRGAFQGIQAEQTGFLKNLSVVFTEPFVGFEEFAARIGLSVDAVRAALTEKTPPDYILLPNGLVKKDRLEQIGKKVEERINRSGRLPLSESIKIAETEGVEDAASALEALGYRIVWHGISTEKAEVIKPKNKGN
jgi:predicted nuclease of restriction endonuclease-like RecB superfamily